MDGDVEARRARWSPWSAVGSGLLRVLSMGFLADEDQAIMWRGLILNRAVQQFLQDAHWGDLDYLLIDLPPGTGDVQMGLARLLPRTELLVVTTPPVAAQKVAARAADMARKGYLRVAGVIENMSDFTCEHGTRYALFGTGGGQRLADGIGVPLIGTIPFHPDLAGGGDTGRPVAGGDGELARVFATGAGRAEEVAPVIDGRAARPACSSASRRPSRRASAATDDAEPERLPPRRSGGGQVVSSPFVSGSVPSPAATPGRRRPASRGAPTASSARWQLAFGHVGVDREKQVVHGAGPVPARAAATTSSRSSRWATMPAITSSGLAMSRPWPGAIERRPGRVEEPAEAGEVGGMSPSGGWITTVDPCITWSPEKSSSCSSSSQQRWSEACPGVCSARRREVRPGRAPSPALAHPPVRREVSTGPYPITSAPVAAASAAAPGAWSGWWWVTTTQRIVPPRAPPRPRWPRVRLEDRPGVDDRDVGRPDQVGVGPGAGHRPGVGRRQPQDARCHLVDPAGLGRGADAEVRHGGDPGTRTARRPRGHNRVTATPVAARRRHRGPRRWPAWRRPARPR